MYSWTLLTHRPGDVPYMLGITDDLAHVRSVVEPYLRSGQAFLCYIEQVRFAMTAADMNSCYAYTGQYWIGRLAEDEQVVWTEHCGAVVPPDQRDGPGWTHATTDLH